MSLFLVVFFLTYGSLHAYAFLRARTALRLDIPTTFTVVFFMSVMVAAPVLVRLSERNDYEILARSFSYAGYTWMGFLFFFVIASLAIDAYRVAVLLGGLINNDLRRMQLSPQSAFYVPLILSLSIAVYAYSEANSIRLEKVVIQTPKISKEVGSLKIVQISDVHLGLMAGKKKLGKILALVKKAEPDILVVTGDLVDGQSDGLSGTTKMLREIQPRYGKFAVTGNHEFYAGIAHSLDFLKRAGFTVLRNQALSIKDALTVAGVDDQTGERFDNPRKIEEQELLAALPEERFTLLLKHRPVVNDASLGLFDLQLSGHTHKGQIFPFTLITRHFFPLSAQSLNQIGDSLLYVSRGTGTWGPPMRFLSPPEITLIELVHGAE